MAERQKANGGWFARWRQHRRTRRQDAIERAYYERERTRASGGPRSAPSARHHGAPASSWLGFGGDGGGGCGGGDGGAC